MSDELLTYAEAAAYLDKKLNTLRTWVRKGRLVKANPPTDHPQAVALFRKADLDAIGDPGAAYQARRRERREAILASGERPCLGPCGRTLPLSEFKDFPGGIGGKTARCRACLREYDARYKRAHRDKYTAARSAWWHRTIETRRPIRNAWRRRIFADKASPVRARILARNRRRNSVDARLCRALEWGKCSPICRRTGFSIAIDAQTGRMRAARLDVSLSPGETALVQYGFVTGRWVVLPVQVKGHPLCSWVHARCRRIEARARAGTHGQSHNPLGGILEVVK